MRAKPSATFSLSWSYIFFLSAFSVAMPVSRSFRLLRASFLRAAMASLWMAIWFWRFVSTLLSVSPISARDLRKFAAMVSISSLIVRYMLSADFLTSSRMSSNEAWRFLDSVWMSLSRCAMASLIIFTRVSSSTRRTSISFSILSWNLLTRWFMLLSLTAVSVALRVRSSGLSIVWVSVRVEVNIDILLFS
eukprot:XP_001705426.1 Hypothetical protein GL50803_32265 [Giardia lamblia ATCC 50803]